MKLTSENIGHTWKAAMLKIETDPSSFRSTDWQQNQSQKMTRKHTYFPMTLLSHKCHFSGEKKIFQRFVVSLNM